MREEKGRGEEARRREGKRGGEGRSHIFHAGSWLRHYKDEVAILWDEERQRI